MQRTNKSIWNRMIVINFSFMIHTEDKLLSSTIVILYQEDKFRMNKLPQCDNWHNKWNKSVTVAVRFLSCLTMHLAPRSGAKWGLQNINFISMSTGNGIRRNSSCCQDCSCGTFTKIVSTYQDFSPINALNGLSSESHQNHLSTSKHLEMVDAALVLGWKFPRSCGNRL